MEQSKGLSFALIGNQNCGKTTLFNQLTGSNQHVGNFPGVTVEKKEGAIKKHHFANVVDLPGIYSLSPYTSEEVVTRDFLIGERPDCIINILDATNIERNLYLTLQIIELQLPMILALNMMDEVRSAGNSIDIQELAHELGVPVVPISAVKNEGVDELIEQAISVAKKRRGPKKLDFCTGEVHKAVHAIAHIIEDNAAQANIPLRFAATKMVEGDALIADVLKLPDMELDIIGHLIDDMQHHLEMDAEAALADMRYTYIEELCKKTVIRKGETKEQIRSIKIDEILTHKIFALPIFVGVMGLVFWLTFGVFGAGLSDLFSGGIDWFTNIVDVALTGTGVNPVIHSLVIDGIFAGVGSVLGFLPTIMVLFFLLSILEDSGYMARVAFVMDKLLRKIGLSGRSFVPMVIGFGCSVPAIMATRTLASQRDRRMTIALVPFMSCSAKLPIYAVFTAAFFKEYQAVVMIILYFTGMIVAVLSGFLFKSTIFKGKPVPFVMELPAYRFPAGKTIVLHMWDKAKDFLKRAFTIIFLATILIWFLQSFDFRFNLVSDTGSSMLASLGMILAPIFAPLGFGDWRMATALVTGLAAKEAVVSTLAVLLGASTETLPLILGGLMNPVAAFAFLCFTLLYMPCVAAFAATKRELGSLKGAVVTMAYQTGVAWVVAFLVYQIGSIFFASLT